MTVYYWNGDYYAGREALIIAITNTLTLRVMKYRIQREWAMSAEQRATQPISGRKWARNRARIDRLLSHS